MSQIFHITQDQVKALLREIPDDRARTAVLVMYLHGLRVSEVCSGSRTWESSKGTQEASHRGLRVSDVQGGYITVSRLKGSAKTTQSLFTSDDPALDEVSQLETVIAKYELGPEDLIYPGTRSTLWRMLQKAGSRAGIAKHLCHPHVLKHSIAMFLVKRIHIDELKQYLGHKSLNSTGMYLRVNDAQASQAVMGALSKEKL